MAINIIGKPYFNITNIFATYRYPFSALFLMQKGYFPIQTNDITLTANPTSPTVALCRNFTLNAGVTYSQPYICVTATNSITINGVIDANVNTNYISKSFFLDKILALPIDTTTPNDYPSGGGSVGVPYGFGGGAAGNYSSTNVNPAFNYRVLYTDFTQRSETILSKVQKSGGYISGKQYTAGVYIGGIVVLCAPIININGNILAYGRDDIQTATYNAGGSGGGVVYLVGDKITLGSVSIDVHGGNATTISGYTAYGGGGGFIVIAGTGSITNNATTNVSGGTASGGTRNYNGQNGSLIVTTFSFDFDSAGNF